MTLRICLFCMYIDFIPTFFHTYVFSKKKKKEEKISYPFIVMFILQNRAQAATELLQELNSDVSGNFVEEVGISLAAWLPVTLMDSVEIRNK